MAPYPGVLIQASSALDTGNEEAEGHLECRKKMTWGWRDKPTRISHSPPGVEGVGSWICLCFPPVACKLIRNLGRLFLASGQYFDRSLVENGARLKRASLLLIPKSNRQSVEDRPQNIRLHAVQD